MSGNNLLDKVRSGPVTQSRDAIKNLLTFVGRASDPMPCDVTLDNGRLVLVLNNKRDAYYVTTAHACSCPAATYRRGPCKHQRRYFADQVAKLTATASESIRPTAGWVGPDGQRANGPVEA
jgi:hypothetical protein